VALLPGIEELTSAKMCRPGDTGGDGSVPMRWLRERDYDARVPRPRLAAHARGAAASRLAISERLDRPVVDGFNADTDTGAHVIENGIQRALQESNLEST
jgi:hypothetical protein